LLARAVQQFHTYPPSSQMCVNAIDACQRALVGLEGREQIIFRVMPRELILDEVPVGAGTVVEQELARRLHSASIAQVTIERAASARELARFCFDLLQCDSRHGLQVSLLDLLEEHGVTRIALSAAHRPQVLEVAAPSAPVAQLIEHQRSMRDQQLATGGPIDHLYPPDKGWVRLDPTARFEQVSLIDLALLAQDPTTLAGMLLRLTEDDVTDVEGGEDALSRKFSDVAVLFAALDPRISRVMFGKLARAVLDLEPERRQTLLKKTILPGLLDGKIDGNVLKDFPDLELAESLCLLLDLETAAPEVVTSALERLDLSPERHAAVLPLVEKHTKARAHTEAEDAGLDAHARKLTRIDRDKARSFAEFSAFDLSIDDTTVKTLENICTAISATDTVVTQLDCLARLIRLEPNPELVLRFLHRSSMFADVLERDERWAEIAVWLSRQREMAAALAESRPDVCEAINASLAAFCTVHRAARLVELAGRDSTGRAAADAIVEALGPNAGPALLEALRTQASTTKDTARAAAVQLLCDHAKLVAPALVAALKSSLNGSKDKSSKEEAEDIVHRATARVLGYAGAGYEPALGTLITSADEQTVREAFRSLAKIATPRAASLVAAEVSRNRGWVGVAAEQTLWHFPRSEADRQLRELLSQRDFVMRHPQVAGRLLDRAAQHNAPNLAPILQSLVPFRFRFWNPALMRVARQAQTMLAK
jgi:hypothetical protein